MEDFPGEPIFLGKMKTPLDWRGYRQRCMSRLGYVPTKELNLSEMDMLGFTYAAREIRRYFPHAG